MAPRPAPAAPRLNAHPAVALGKAAPNTGMGSQIATALELGADIALEGVTDEAAPITGSATEPLGLDPAGLAPAPSTSPSTSDLPEDDLQDDFQAQLTALFEQRHPVSDVAPAASDEPQGETAPTPPGDAAATTDGTPSAPEPTPVPTSTPAVPAPAKSDAEQLAEWMQTLSPDQLYAMQLAVQDPSRFINPASPTAAPATPAAPTPDPIASLSQDLGLSPAAEEFFRAQQQQLAAVNAQLVQLQSQSQASTHDAITRRVLTARDQWATSNQITPEALARIEALPATTALMQRYADEMRASSRDDYEAVTHRVLDEAAWLDPETRAARMSMVAADAAARQAEDMARVRARAVAASSVSSAVGSAPRVEPNPKSLTKQDRAKGGEAMFAEAMGLGG